MLLSLKLYLKMVNAFGAGLTPEQIEKDIKEAHNLPLEVALADLMSYDPQTQFELGCDVFNGTPNLKEKYTKLLQDKGYKIVSYEDAIKYHKSITAASPNSKMEDILSKLLSPKQDKKEDEQFKMDTPTTKWVNFIMPKKESNN